MHSYFTTGRMSQVPRNLQDVQRSNVIRNSQQMLFLRYHPRNYLCDLCSSHILSQNGLMRSIKQVPYLNISIFRTEEKDGRPSCTPMTCRVQFYGTGRLKNCSTLNMCAKITSLKDIYTHLQNMDFNYQIHLLLHKSSARLGQNTTKTAVKTI